MVSFFFLWFLKFGGQPDTVARCWETHVDIPGGISPHLLPTTGIKLTRVFQLSRILRIRGEHETPKLPRSSWREGSNARHCCVPDFLYEELTPLTEREDGVIISEIFLHHEKSPCPIHAAERGEAPAKNFTRLFLVEMHANCVAPLSPARLEVLIHFSLKPSLPVTAWPRKHDCHAALVFKYLNSK